MHIALDCAILETVTDLMRDPALAVVVTLVATVVATLTWLYPRKPRPTAARLTPSEIEEQLATLSHTVTRHWRQQLPKQGLDPAADLPVRPGWSADVDTASPSLDVMFGGAISGHIRRLHLTGRTTTTAAGDFLTLPTRQLVVLGRPGAGKSVLAGLLARDLQSKRRQLGRRVPVVFTAAGWRPRATPLTSWMADVLTLDFGIARATARQLIDLGAVMPIVDGLDECADPGTAVRQLHEWAQRDTPFVVTCRNRPFLDAHTDHGALARAAVVELRPLNPEDSLNYLDPHRAARWEKARDKIEQNETLATVLTSPLMVSLARDRYRHIHPDELCTMDQPETLSEVLLDQFIPMAFAEETGEYSAANAHRWLTFIAEHLHRRNSALIAW